MGKWQLKRLLLLFMFNDGLVNASKHILLVFC